MATPIREAALAANGFMPVLATFLVGRTLDQITIREDLSPEVYAAIALQWIDQGTRILGGCCATDPAHIACLRKVILECGLGISRM